MSTKVRGRSDDGLAAVDEVGFAVGCFVGAESGMVLSVLGKVEGGPMMESVVEGPSKAGVMGLSNGVAS